MLLQKQVFCWLLGSANPSLKGHLGQWAKGPYLMTLKVLCSKRAVGVGRPRAKACFRVSMLRLQSSASFSNLRVRGSCSGRWSGGRLGAQTSRRGRDGGRGTYLLVSAMLPRWVNWLEWFRHIWGEDK